VTRLDLCLDALDAVELGDEVRLRHFITQHLRLADARTWLPHVAEALWRAGRNGSLQRVRNPLAYVRALAQRIEYATCRESLFGTHIVWDGSRRRHIGTVTVSSYSSQAMQVTPDCTEMPFYRPAAGLPAARRPPRLQRASQYHEDSEEFMLAVAVDQGVPRRVMPGYLGWSPTHVERVWKRMYRASRRIGRG